MSPPTFQTTRLTRGRHATPADGVCAMELASMLAGDPFSDRPQSVCPAVGGFLRGYNDHLDDELRQDLFGAVGDVVGSGHDEWLLLDRRAWSCMDWARAAYRELPVLRRRFLLFNQSPADNCELAGRWTADLTRFDGELHERTLRFVDGLANELEDECPPADAWLAPVAGHELSRAGGEALHRADRVLVHALR